jgi:hypothetical protein
MKIFVYFKPIMLLSLLLPVLAEAAPQLTSLTLSSPTDVVLNGTGFGAGPNVIFFDNFEKQQKFIQTFTSNTLTWNNGEITLKESSGNTALRARDPKTPAGAKGEQELEINFNKNYTEAFIFYSVKIPPNTNFSGASTPKTFPPVSSWKFIWLYLGVSGFENPNDFDICMPTHVGNGSFLMGGNDGNLGWIEDGVNWWEWDQYNHMSNYIRFDPTSPLSNPVQYFWSVTNNRVNTPLTIKNQLPSQFTDTAFAFDRIHIPGWIGNGNFDNFDGLYDNIYLALGNNALARVMISDSADYTKSHYVVAVPSKSWSDTQIVLDADVLPIFGKLFVHVFDKSGNISTSGIPLICLRCPKPPTPTP